MPTTKLALISFSSLIYASFLILSAVSAELHHRVSQHHPLLPHHNPRRLPIRPAAAARNNPTHNQPNAVAAAVALAAAAANVINKLRPRVVQNDFLPREYLQAHNKFRVSIGEPPLLWDRKLALFARRYAAKRARDCGMVHSLGPYGENLFWGGRADMWTPTQVVESWVKEQDFYNKTSNECAKGQMCGHYTQVVWRDTARVGCARIKCENNPGLFIICNYDPPGNFHGESPFVTHNNIHLDQNVTPSPPSSPLVPPPSSSLDPSLSPPAPPPSMDSPPAMGEMYPPNLPSVASVLVGSAQAVRNFVDKLMG